MESNFYFPKYHILYMSHWKVLNSKGISARNGSEKRDKSKAKFSPTKSKGDGEMSIRFRNQSLSRIHDSMMSNSIKDRSLNKSLFKSNNQSNGLKNCLSEVQLKKSLTSESGFGLSKALRQIQSNNNDVILPVSITQNDFEKKLQKMPENCADKTMYQAQIDKIKKQFKDFQEAIFLELRRQQKIINAMIDKILQQIQQKLIEPTINTELQQNGIIKQLQKQGEKLSIKMTQSHNVKLVEKTSENTIHPSGITTKNGKETQDNGQNFQEKLSFNRFFDAMNMLKKQMKDISSLSSVASPRSTGSNQHWKAALQRLKKSHK